MPVTPMTLDEARELLDSIGYREDWSRPQLLDAVKGSPDEFLLCVQRALRITGQAAQAKADALEAEPQAMFSEEPFRVGSGPKQQGTTGFELRVAAANARAAIARVREFIGIGDAGDAEAARVSEAFNIVDQELATVVEEPAFRDDLDQDAIREIVDRAVRAAFI